MTNERKRAEEVADKVIQKHNNLDNVIVDAEIPELFDSFVEALLQFSKEESERAYKDGYDLGKEHASNKQADRVTALEAELATKDTHLKLAVEALEEYGQHDKECILAQWRAGRPTEDGGYEMLCGYGKKEKWYRTKPVDESPKCECGFTKALEEIRGKE